MTKRVLAVLLFTMVLLAAARGAQTRYPVQYTGQYQGHGTYKTCDMASDKKVAYFSLIDNNKGHTPGVSPTFWVLASAPSKCAIQPVPPTPPPTPPPPTPPVTGPIALIAHDGAPTGTLATLNTAGANFVQVCARANVTINDDGNHVWTSLPNAIGGYSGSSVGAYVLYALNSPTLTNLSTSDRSPFTVMAFSGVASLDQKNANGSGAYPQVVGPITPTASGELATSCTNGNMNPVGNGSTNSLTTSAPWTVTDFAMPNVSVGWPNATGSAYAILTAVSPVSIAMNLSQRNGQVTNQQTFFGTSNAPAPTLTLAGTIPEAALNAPYVTVVNGVASPVAGSCPTAAGGVQPFRFSGTAPAGLGIDPVSGCPVGTPTATVTSGLVSITITDQSGKSSTVTTRLSVAASPIRVAGGSCPVAKQLKPYSCGILQATGGIGTLHYAASTDPAFQGLPGGTSVDPNTGLVSSARIMDQGNYTNVGLRAYDDFGGQATLAAEIDIDGDNSFGGVRAFPKDSVYHLKVTNLPDDTSIRSRFPSYYADVRLGASFGPGAETGGFVFHTYPANSPMVPTRSSFGGNQYALGPVPCNVGVEGDRNQIPQSEATGSPDIHVLGMYAAGVGADGIQHPWRRYESYNTFPAIGTTGNCSWGNPLDPAGAGFGAAVFPPGPDTDVLTSYEMPNPGATTNAGGTPLLAVTYEEAASGDIGHPLLITMSKLGQFYSWPGTASAPAIHDNCPVPGLASGDIQPWDQAHPPKCYDGNGAEITTAGQTTVVAGMIYHLPPATAEPLACAANPLLHALFRATIDYGVMVTDNGLNGRVLGTKDRRWLDWGSLNGCLNQIRLGDMVAPQVWKTAADPNYRSSKILPQYVTP